MSNPHSNGGRFPVNWLHPWRVDDATIPDPVGLALKREKLDEAVGLVQAKVNSGDVHAAVLHVSNGKDVLNQAFGAAKTPNAVFLLASISKPMTATAVMILSDRKQLSIEDPVRKYIPEFKGGEKDQILVRHLLTHSSGLPDMLPENEELRKRHAPLKDFVAATCSTPLLFPPGTKVKYQSMGILLAGEIVGRVSGKPLPDFLRDEVYRPLGMKDTSMGMGGRRIDDTMQVQVDVHNDWDWNSQYWRNLGAPWGGAHASAADVSRFLRYFTHPDPPVLRAATAADMIVDHNQGLNSPWGLGWTLGRGFGKRSSPKVYGHGGSTGTLSWLDPEKDLSFVLLTTKPSAVSGKLLLNPVADIVSEA